MNPESHGFGIDHLVSFLRNTETPGRMIITGSPGAGKTFFLRFGCHKLKEEQKRQTGSDQTPAVYIDLEEYNQHTMYGLEDAIAEGLKRDDTTGGTKADYYQPEMIVDSIRRRRIVLVVDHYEALDRMLGRKALYAWERYTAQTIIGNPSAPDLGARIVVGCEKGYFESRSQVGLFNAFETANEVWIPITHPEYGRVRKAMCTHLEKKAAELGYFFPGDQQVTRILERLRELKPS